MSNENWKQLEASLAQAKEACERFQAQNSQVIKTWLELTRQKQNAANELARAQAEYHRSLQEQYIKCCFVEDGDCSRAFDRATRREVSLSEDELYIVDSSVSDVDGHYNAPDGWTVGHYTCGCGSDGNFYCPDHEQGDDRNHCGPCSR